MNTEQRPKLWKETGADSTGGREEQISRAGVKCMAVVMLVFAAGMRVQAVRTEAGNRPRARGVLTTSPRPGLDEPGSVREGRGGRGGVSMASQASGPRSQQEVD